MIGNFGFFLPTQIMFGRGVVKEVGEEIKARGLKKPMLVTDAGIIKIGLADQIKGKKLHTGYVNATQF